MVDEETPKPLPYTAHPVMLSLFDRMSRSGIPEKLDKKYLVGMAEGTQFQYRQGFRYLGLTTDSDEPTPLLVAIVNANQADRRELFGKIMSDRYPDLFGLPLNASREDFFTVLLERYGVASDIQRKKMLTFYVAAADYAKLPISASIRPDKPGTRRRKPIGRRRPPVTSAAKSAAGAPEKRTDHSGREANGGSAEQGEISFGDAATATVVVNVRWWFGLPADQLLKLRELIKDIEALASSGS